MSTGVFTTKRYAPKNSKDYVGIGDPYGKKVPKKPQDKDAQFQTRPPLKGQTAGYFNKSTYDTANLYVDTKSYRNVQPLADRKLGFCSRDAFRRDEFSLDIRSRQWKEKLKVEMDFAKQAIQNTRPKTGTQPLPGETRQQMRQRLYREKYKDHPELFQTQVTFHSYDIGRTAVTPFNNKSTADTFYDLKRVAQLGLRRPGPNPTSYETYGNFKVKAEKPQFGSVNVCKQFYDHSHFTTRRS